MTTYEMLRKWARYIEREVPIKKWNMGIWCEKENGCGTVGCSAGHAAVLFPQFLKQNFFSYSESGGGISTLNGRFTDTCAIQRVFGITLYEANQICLPSEYDDKYSDEFEGICAIPKTTVANRIRETARNYQSRPDNFNSSNRD